MLSHAMLGGNPNSNYTTMAWSSPSMGRSPDWVFSEASSTQYEYDQP